MPMTDSDVTMVLHTICVETATIPQVLENLAFILENASTEEVGTNPALRRTRLMILATCMKGYAREANMFGWEG